MTFAIVTFGCRVNQADSLAYAAEKALRDLGDKVPGNDRASIEQKIAALREALQGDDVAKIRSLSDEVQQASYALGQMAGQSAQQQAGGTRGPNGERPDGERRDEGDVVEGEFREA